MKKIILSLGILLFEINLNANIVQESEIACNEGNAKKCLEVGLMYSREEIVERDISKSKKYINKACKGGNARGCFFIGFSYDVGEGVEQNYLKAKEFYTKACDGNNSEGCLQLGSMYFEGKGIKKDCVKSKYFFKKDCDLGDMGGCYILGTMYYSCKTCSCITPDFVKAKDFVNKACMGGYTIACNALKTIDIPNFYTKMADDLLAQNNSSKALEYYNEALKNMGKKHPDKIQCYLGIGSVYGARGDNPKALEYFEKALVIVQEANKEEINHIYVYKKLALIHEIMRNSYKEIAHGFVEIQGNIADYWIALDYYKKALTLSRKILGEMNLITADLYCDVARLYLKGKMDGTKTLEHYMKALDIKEKILGKEHQDVVYIREKILETHNILLNATQKTIYNKKN